MAIDFPPTPTLGYIYTYGGRSWQWNGIAWDIYSTSTGTVVNTLNGLSGGVTLAAGTNITLTPFGNTITIASSGGGGTTGATGATGPQGNTGPVGDYVSTFNGLTGAVTGVTVGGTNVFTALNTFNVGISAAGSSFSSTTNTIDIIASTDGAGLRIAQATTGSASRIGGIRLGRNANSSLNTYLESSSGIFTIYNGVGATGTKIVDFTTTATGFSGAVSATGLITANAGISASGGVTLAGTLQGTTATFTGILKATAGISASTLVVEGGSSFGAAVDHVFGLSNRGLKINAGKGSSEVLSYGNETLSISAMGGNSTLEMFGRYVTVGDDGNNDGTQIVVDDTIQTITYSSPSGGGHIFNGIITANNNITAPNIVNSVNGLIGNVNFVAGTNITITPAGNTLTVASSGGGGGVDAAFVIAMATVL